MNKLCKKASEKKILSLFTSQFSYFPPVWMFHSNRRSKKINVLHEKALGITYGYKTYLLYELLEHKSVSIHH